MTFSGRGTHALDDTRELLLRQCEDDRYRRDLIDHHQAVGSGVDDVALVHEPNAGAAADRGNMVQ